MRSRIAVYCIALLTLFHILSTSTLANERIFGYTYQTNVLGKGHREIEIWNTFRFQREDFYRRFIHRVEYEIGLGGGVQTAFYLNIENTAAYRSGMQPTIEKELAVGFSNEWKFKLSDPAADAVGSALYAEVGVFANELELEAKLILDKQIGNGTHALNIVAEPEWEVEADGSSTETEYEFNLEFDYGFSYRLNESWNVGLEIRSHQEYTPNAGWEHSAVFAGPTLAYRTEGWWMTLTVLPQVYAFKTEPGSTHKHLELRGHERLETRLLFSFEL